MSSLHTIVQHGVAFSCERGMCASRTISGVHDHMHFETTAAAPYTIRHEGVCRAEVNPEEPEIDSSQAVSRMSYASIAAPKPSTPQQHEEPEAKAESTEMWDALAAACTSGPTAPVMIQGAIHAISHISQLIGVHVQNE